MNEQDARLLAEVFRAAKAACEGDCFDCELELNELERAIDNFDLRASFQVRA